MWEVHPISQPIHWEEEEAEMTHFLFLPGEPSQGAAEF